MFSETRYAMNGDLRVAYRASPHGARDIVFVSQPFTNCEVFPELPSLQGWFEAMTSLGRLIFFDQPGTGVSDPVTPAPTLEQWADSITAVLDDLGSRRSGPRRDRRRVPRTAALFAATHPSRTTALVVLEGYADPLAERTEGVRPARKLLAAWVAMWGTGEFAAPDESGHAVERGNPGSLGTTRTPGGQPRDRCSHDAAGSELDVRALLPTVRVPTLVVQHTDDPVIPPEMGQVRR